MRLAQLSNGRAQTDNTRAQPCYTGRRRSASYRVTMSEPVDPRTVVDAAARLRGEFPYYGAHPQAPVQLAEVYAELVATAVAKARFYGALLAEAYAEHGVDALVGVVRSGAVLKGGKNMPDELETYDASEQVRALVVLEGAERDRAERLTREAIKLGIEANRVDVMRSYARTVVEVTRAMAAELGLDWASPTVRRVAQRSILAARATLGYGQGSPDDAGMRLSPVEAAALLGNES